MEGYRTYASIIIIVLGWLGVADIITEDKVAEAINLLVQLVGIISATYYNHINHKKIEVLKGR